MGFFRIPNQPEAKIKWHTNETIKEKRHAGQQHGVE